MIHIVAEVVEEWDVVEVDRRREEVVEGEEEVLQMRRMVVRGGHSSRINSLQSTCIGKELWRIVAQDCGNYRTANQRIQIRNYND